MRTFFRIVAQVVITRYLSFSDNTMDPQLLCNNYSHLFHNEQRSRVRVFRNVTKYTLSQLCPGLGGLPCHWRSGAVWFRSPGKRKIRMKMKMKA